MLFEQRYDFGTSQTTANYDISQDGNAFLMVKADTNSERLNVVVNWFDGVEAIEK